MADDNWRRPHASVGVVKKNQNKADRFVSRHGDLNLGRVIDVSQRYSLFLRTLKNNGSGQSFGAKGQLVLTGYSWNGFQSKNQLGSLLKP